MLNFRKFRNSFSKIKKSQQKNPKPIHEMPVVGSDFRGRRKRNFCLFKLPEGNKKQSADTPQEVDCVRARENIKKTAGLVARDVNALRDKLPPRNELPGNKKKTKDRCHQPEFAKPETSARKSRRRADSRVKLLARRMHVLAQRIRGRWTVTHSSLPRRKTMKALASAIKNIKMETMPIAIAVE